MKGPTRNWLLWILVWNGKAQQSIIESYRLFLLSFALFSRSPIHPSSSTGHHRSLHLYKFDTSPVFLSLITISPQMQIFMFSFPFFRETISVKGNFLSERRDRSTEEKRSEVISHEKENYNKIRELKAEIQLFMYYDNILQSLQIKEEVKTVATDAKFEECTILGGGCVTASPKWARWGAIRHDANKTCLISYIRIPFSYSYSDFRKPSKSLFITNFVANNFFVIIDDRKV